MWSYFLVFLSGVGLTGFVALFFKKGITLFMETHFKKGLEKFKHSLDLITEGAKFDYQIKLSDFNLYVQKKHAIYSELYRLLMVAEGKISGMRGLKWLPTFEEFDEVDVVKYLEHKNVTHGEIECVRELWKTDKKGAVKKIHDYLKNEDLKEARIAFFEASNKYWVSVIYLSDGISQKSKLFIDKMGALLSHYEFPPDVSESREERKQSREECNKLKEDITKLIEEMISLMKSELTLTGNNSK